jgi:hypothetical protein
LFWEQVGTIFRAAYRALDVNLDPAPPECIINDARKDAGLDPH